MLCGTQNRLNHGKNNQKLASKWPQNGPKYCRKLLNIHSEDMFLIIKTWPHFFLINAYLWRLKIFSFCGSSYLPIPVCCSIALHKVPYNNVFYVV